MKHFDQFPRLPLVLLLVFSLIVTASPFVLGTQVKVVEQEDEFNRIHGAVLKDGTIVQISSEELPAEAFSNQSSDGPSYKKSADEALTDGPAEKLHPKLEAMLADGYVDAMEDVIVTFREDLKVPRFPEPRVDESRDSEYNQMALARAEELISNIEKRRAARYEGFRQELNLMSRGFGEPAMETFWLIPAAATQVPRSALRSLAERDDVLYVEPAIDGSLPPIGDGNNNNDVADGRARMTSDPYFNLGQTSGWIGLLDTGLRFSHTLFNNPSNISLRYDCVNGGGQCILSGANYNPNDDCWNHGTSTAAIISGNSNLGFDFRGVTGVRLDSFKVYPNSCGGLNTTAVVAAFQRSVAVLDRVIVAEMQGGGGETSAISQAADAAFDAGAVVIAANGNNGPNLSTVNTPANAHKAIGVGAVDVQTGTQYGSQSRGPAPDGRFKPDIQAPNNAETASSASDTALRTFGGTSGATPFAAGAATLLRNWLRGTSFSIDPGQVYAHLILSGRDPYPFDNTVGAGELSLPVNGYVWWGKTTITNGATIDIPLPISGASFDRFDAALWWPETAAQAHNDVDVQLIDPFGTVRASSVSINSVFERARHSGAVVTGAWKLRIHGFSVSGSQTVYWAAHVRDL
jgi:hypothetical protein